MNKTLEPIAKSTSFGAKISFTADTVAFARTKSGIPLCKTIFDIAERIGGPLDIKEKTRTDGRPDLHAYVEARYLLTDQVMKVTGVRQVLELASGLSPRGIITASKPDMRYVEIDLPAKMAVKRQIIDELYKCSAAYRYGNYHLEEGDVTNTDDMQAAEKYFTSESVFIICEGLLRYLNLEDKRKLATNVRDIMQNHPRSIWMTPDIHLLSDVNASTERLRNHEQTVKDWGIDIRPNLFRDIEHAHGFFRSFGFFIREHPIADVANKLVSPKRLGMTKEAVANALKNRKAFVMTL